MDMLRRPLAAGPYPDRDIGCQEALDQAFLALPGLHAGSIADAAGGKLAPPMQALARRAASVGWTIEESEVAISELAQNVLDEMASDA